MRSIRLVGAAVACGGGESPSGPGDGGDDGDGTSASISISLSPGSLTITQGESCQVTVTATDGWLGDAGELDVAIPDFSAVAGWDGAWALEAGTETQWSFTGTGWSGAEGVSSPVYADGVSILTAQASGTVTP